MRTSKRRPQRGRRLVTTCSCLLALCWLGFSAWNLSKKPEELTAFLIGFNIVAAILLFLLPKAIARVLQLVNADSRTSEAIREMQSIRTSRDDSESVPSRSQIETGLPEAWSKLVQDGDDLLVNLVSEKAKSLGGHKPTRAQVLDFLNGLRRSGVQPKEAAVPPSPVESEQTTIPPGRKPPTRLVVTMENGDRIDRRAATDTFVEAVEKIGIERVRNLGLNAGRFSLVSTTQFHEKQRKSGRYFITTHNTTTAEKKQLLETIATELGVKLRIETPVKR
ncbi:MAG: hypothetical protein OXN17_23020 [Candidatus Poribacteria bacterium]|nr:hypothetical protein [Candidatus Poribacteria bacterium]MDE0504215.1 hypothetical protein [Candidatus Poribacteria bacterium]